VGDDTKDRQPDRHFKPVPGNPWNVVRPDAAGGVDEVALLGGGSFLFQTVVGPSAAREMAPADIKARGAIDMR
jgi:hypothetical protein